MAHYKNEKKQIFAGYINLKPINGVIFPSYAQNQINREYIENKLNGEFFMSTNENTYGKNNIVLRSLLIEKNLKGVCFLSIFSLPENYDQRKEFFKITIQNKKQLHFVFEEKVFKEAQDADFIEELLIFNNQFFTKKKVKLNNYEKQFVDKSWSFV